MGVVSRAGLFEIFFVHAVRVIAIADFFFLSVVGHIRVPRFLSSELGVIVELGGGLGGLSTGLGGLRCGFGHDEMTSAHFGVLEEKKEVSGKTAFICGSGLKKEFSLSEN